MSTRTFGWMYGELNGGERVLTQMEVIRDVLLSAVECARATAPQPEGERREVGNASFDGGWMSLRELAELTTYGEASISAQLRHLRKERFGGYVVAKRRRGPAADGVWEYRIAGRSETAPMARLANARLADGGETPEVLTST